MLLFFSLFIVWENFNACATAITYFLLVLLSSVQIILISFVSLIFTPSYACYNHDTSLFSLLQAFILFMLRLTSIFFYVRLFNRKRGLTMTTFERIKYLRKEILGLSQEDFAKKINISRSNLGNIEIGRIGVTDRVINDICRELSVNDDWLRTGTEPIFLDANDPITNEIVKIFNTLTDENKKYLRGYMERLLEEQKESD